MIVSFIKKYPQSTFWIIACITFFIAAFLGMSGLWGLLIYGSFLGGTFVTAIADGRAGLKEYFKRIIRWRVAFKWYVIAFSLPLLLNLVAFGLNIAFGAGSPTSLQWPPLSEIMFAFFWPSFFGIALAEEPGFRGFALPRFLAKHTALKAALIVGALHTLWHLPFLVQMISEGYYLGILTKTLIIISASVFFTWLLNNTQGSVLIAMVLHASDDLFAGDGSPLTFGPLFSGFSAMDIIRQDVLEAAVFAAFALLLIFLLGKELGKKSHVSSLKG